MGLSVSQQYDIAVSGFSMGDFDLLERALVSPDSITIDETKSFSEKLGLKGGFLSAAVNIVADPTVIIAFLMSRKFPTSQFLRGAVPNRFVGTSNEFTGISTIARTVEGFFRGTHIPRMNALTLRRQAEVLKIGNRMFDKTILRNNWKNEKDIVTMLMEGQTPSGATPELRNLSQSLRVDMEDLWKFAGKTHKVEGGFDGVNIERSASRAFTAREAPKHLRDYLPHIPLFGDESLFTLSGKDALAKFSKNKSAQAIVLAGEDPSRVWKLANDRVESSFLDYQNFMKRTQGQVFSPRMFPRKRFNVSLNSSEGAELFITDLDQIMQKYVHSVARTYSLNAPLSPAERAFVSIASPDGVGRILPSAEPPIVQIINQGIDAAGGLPVSRRQVAGLANTFETRIDRTRINAPTIGALGNLVNNLKGNRGTDEILFGNMFNAVRHKISNSYRGLMGQKQQLQLEGGIAALERQAKDRLLTNRITSFFYANVLGLNPSSQAKNLLQPFLTTAPSIGIGPTLAGYKVLKSRLPNYVSAFSRERQALARNPNIPFIQRMNLAQEKAFNKTFPELSQTGIAVDPRAFDLDQRLLEVTATGATRFRSFDEFNRFMLQPFTQTEIANKVVSFYGGKQALTNSIRSGALEIPVTATGARLRGKDFDDFLNFEAASLTAATQFSPGPGSKTVFQSLIPAPFRMFTSFPIRLLNHFANSTIQGALTDKQLATAGALTRATGGRNFGTIARTFVLGRSINLGLREALGVDMGDALGITGPFTNVVQHGNLFPLLPIAPLPGVAVSLASFASTRDVKDLQGVDIPLLGHVPIPRSLIPGGIAINRAAKALQSYRPDLGGFVDEDERLMYQGDTSDLVLSMLGIPLDKERRLREKVGILQGNRFRVRSLRRRFAVASRNYDMKEQQRVSAQFSEEFPEFGPLGISRQDRRRYDEQARLTTLQRMIRSSGKDFRYLENDLSFTDPDLVNSDLIAPEPLNLGLGVGR